MAAIEFARNVLGYKDANSTEMQADTTNPVIDLMAAQKKVKAKGGTMRLGLYPASLREGSVVAGLYGAPEVQERHRHRFEVNNSYRPQLVDAGLVVSGQSPDGDLVEFVELPASVHPFYVSTQAHPELLSRPNRAHPLFSGLIAAAIERQEASALFPVGANQDTA